MCMQTISCSNYTRLKLCHVENVFQDEFAAVRTLSLRLLAALCRVAPEHHLTDGRHAQLDRRMDECTVHGRVRACVCGRMATRMDAWIGAWAWG